MVIPVPPEAQAASALNLVMAAAFSPLLGDAAAYFGTIDQGHPADLVDRGLTTQSGDQSWRRAWCLFLDGGGGGPMPVPPNQPGDTYPVPPPGNPGNRGQERFIQQVDGANGVLRWQPPLDYVPAQGDRFLLFRDYKFGQWLFWLNETARNLHYPLDYAIDFDPEQPAKLRYDLPEVVGRAGWIEDILVGPKDVDPDSPEGRYVRWHRVNPKDVEGHTYLVLSRPLTASQQLLIRARPPFVFEYQTPYTTLDSVLVPAGRELAGGPAVRPPLRLFVFGTVWRCLQQKVTNLTGQPRSLWQQNLERAARQYAQACEEWGKREPNRDLNYSEDWYPWNTTSWSMP